MKKKIVTVGGLPLGGGSPILIQSMLTTRPIALEESLQKIESLREVGCDLIRITVPTMEDVPSFAHLCKESPIPVIADVHFDHRIAVACIENGAAKVRINPGNIGKKENVIRVAHAARACRVPIRVGANAGSLEKGMLAEHKTQARALVESALREIKTLEECHFSDIVVAVKASDVPTMMEAYEEIANRTPYPLHLGVTEAGGGSLARAKSAIGIGSLLAKGIGDTIRVSLSEDPIAEVEAALEILQALKLRPFVDVVSCPTCGRCSYDVARFASEVRARTKHIRKNAKIAVMGCVVNGPGESRDADLGIAAGEDKFVIFRRGEVFRAVSKEEGERVFFALLEELFDEETRAD